MKKCGKDAAMAFVDTLRGDGEQISDAVSLSRSELLSSRPQTALVSHAHGMLTWNLVSWTVAATCRRARGHDLGEGETGRVATSMAQGG